VSVDPERKMTGIEIDQEINRLKAPFSSSLVKIYYNKEQIPADEIWQTTLVDFLEARGYDFSAEPMAQFTLSVIRNPKLLLIHVSGLWSRVRK